MMKKLFILFLYTNLVAGNKQSTTRNTNNTKSHNMYITSALKDFCSKAGLARIARAYIDNLSKEALLKSSIIKESKFDFSFHQSKHLYSHTKKLLQYRSKNSLIKYIENFRALRSLST